VVERQDLVELVAALDNTVEQCGGFIDTGIKGFGLLWRV